MKLGLVFVDARCPLFSPRARNQSLGFRTRAHRPFNPPEYLPPRLVDPRFR